MPWIPRRSRSRSRGPTACRKDIQSFLAWTRSGHEKHTKFPCCAETGFWELTHGYVFPAKVYVQSSTPRIEGWALNACLPMSCIFDWFVGVLQTNNKFQHLTASSKNCKQARTANDATRCEFKRHVPPWVQAQSPESGLKDLARKGGHKKNMRATGTLFCNCFHQHSTTLNLSPTYLKTNITWTPQPHQLLPNSLPCGLVGSF